MKITVDEARGFFAHPSQLRWSMLGGLDDLPEWVDYRASGGVCGAFHLAPWPGVVMGHIGVKLEAWGRVDADALAILSEVWGDYRPQRIAGWVMERNRPMASLARRLGFELDGRLPLAEPVLCFGWRP